MFKSRDTQRVKDESGETTRSSEQKPTIVKYGNTESTWSSGQKLTIPNSTVNENKFVISSYNRTLRKHSRRDKPYNVHQRLAEDYREPKHNNDEPEAECSYGENGSTTGTGPSKY